MVKENCRLGMVRCKICIVVECCDTLLIPKFDGLQKHVGHQKARFAHPNMHVGEYFMHCKNQYIKNENLSFNKLLMMFTLNKNVKFV